MQTISQILDNQAKTHSDGSKKSDGEKVISLVQNQLTTSTSAHLRQQQEATQKQPILTSDDKIKLTRLITTCYEALNVYGKSPEQLEAVITLMHMTLTEHSYGIIRRAFERHIKESAVMPTPHDILKTIKKMDDEDLCNLYVHYGMDTEQENIIRKLGIANSRRKLGVTRKQDRTSHDLLDNWEVENNQKVTWENLEEYYEQNKQ